MSEWDEQPRRSAESRGRLSYSDSTRRSQPQGQRRSSNNYSQQRAREAQNYRQQAESRQRQAQPRQQRPAEYDRSQRTRAAQDPRVQQASQRQRTRSSQQPQQNARGQRMSAAQRQQVESYSRSSYSRTGGSGNGGGRPPQRSFLARLIDGNPLRLAILIIVIIAVIVALVLGIRACTKKDAPADDSGQTVEQENGTTPLEPGRIVMTIGGDHDTIVLQGEDYIEGGCHAIDRQEGDISANIQITDDVNTNVPGDYTVTYTVRNSENMEATETRNVHVVSDMDVDRDGISVFMYHYVYTEEDQPETLDTNYILNTKFEQHLQYLTENDYYFPSFAELRAYIDGTHSLPQKSVVLTFDDGEFGFLDYGIPLLEQYQVPATSFIICSDTDLPDRLYSYASPYVSFQSHTFDLHQGGTSGMGHGGKIFDLSFDELVADFQHAQSILGTTEALAYPFGDVSDAAPSAVDAAGILCAFTTNYGQVHTGDDPAQLSRIRIFGDGDVSGFYYQCDNGN